MGDRVADRLRLALWPQETDLASLSLPGRPSSPVVYFELPVFLKADGCVCSLNLRADPRVG